MKRLSNIAEKLKGQEMFQIFTKANELEKKGKHIIHFELGDPDFDTPKNIINAAVDSLNKGDTHYVSSKGLEELIVAASESTEKGRRKFKPNLNQLLVTHGANVQIDYAITCTVEQGEDIIVPDPGFVSYFSIISCKGMNAVRVPLYEKNKFRLNPKDVEKAITNKTKMIIINSPSNPTGAVMKEEEIRKIYEIAEKHDVYILSDEVYTRLIYEDSDTKFFSPSMIDKCKERTIIVNGFSKACAMTGWRLGIATGPKDVIKKMNLLLETSTSCVPPFIQKAGIEALKGPSNNYKDMIKEYKIRRDILVEGLNNLPGISCLKPTGAFYVFPNITKTNMTSREFADFMLDKAGIALAPGAIFGKYGDNYVRLSYANSIENIKKGIEKMRIALTQKRYAL